MDLHREVTRACLEELRRIYGVLAVVGAEGSDWAAGQIQSLDGLNGQLEDLEAEGELPKALAPVLKRSTAGRRR